VAEIDREKEVIGFLKTGFFFFLGTLFGLIAYLFNFYDKLNDSKLLIISIGILLNVIILIFLAKKTKKELDKLRDL